MSDDRIHIEPEGEGGLEKIWIAGQPVGKMLQRLNKRVDELATENERLTKENERLKERVAELEARVDPDPTAKEYEDMSRDERVRKLREAVVREAQRNHSGKARMRYKEVMALFDHRPSAAYAYKLMEIAGEEDGFNYVDNNGKAIQANTESVKDETLFHGANKTITAEAG